MSFRMVQLLLEATLKPPLFSHVQVLCDNNLFHIEQNLLTIALTRLKSMEWNEKPIFYAVVLSNIGTWNTLDTRYLRNSLHLNCSYIEKSKDIFLNVKTRWLSEQIIRDYIIRYCATFFSKLIEIKTKWQSLFSHILSQICHLSIIMIKLLLSLIFTIRFNRNIFFWAVYTSQ